MYAKIRAFWAHRQGLLAPVAQAPDAALQATGWARSVGGVGPYFTLWARGGLSRVDCDHAIADGAICELPSARGCTYVLPQAHYALGLKLNEPGAAVPIAAARKYLGVTEEEVERLCESMLFALSDGPLDPRELKSKLGDAVRNLGEEGKKRGQSTTLSLGLGRLQSKGAIRRIPVSGRLDSERYRYALWPDFKPFDGSPSDAHRELAKLYWNWTGAASLKQFQWFSGLGVAASKAATAELELVLLEGTDILATRPSIEEYETFEVPAEPRYLLTTALDGILLLRRDFASVLDPSDWNRHMAGEKALVVVGGLQDAANHVILDRGRVIGVWEYDAFAKELVYAVFGDSGSRAATKACGTGLMEAVARAEGFVREELGDARSFSLDSPESRRTRINLLRQLAAT